MGLSAHVRQGQSRGWNTCGAWALWDFFPFSLLILTEFQAFRKIARTTKIFFTFHPDSVYYVLESYENKLQTLYLLPPKASVVSFLKIWKTFSCNNHSAITQLRKLISTQYSDLIYKPYWNSDFTNSPHDVHYSKTISWVTCCTWLSCFSSHRELSLQIPLSFTTAVFLKCVGSYFVKCPSFWVSVVFPCD